MKENNKLVKDFKEHYNYVVSGGKTKISKNNFFYWQNKTDLI